MSDLDLVSVIVRLAAGAWLLWRIPRPEQGSARPRPSLSIVVPARNEERSLPRLLGSLRPQLEGTDEVIVVDDDSTDDTAAVAAAGGATAVITAPPLPDGWTGKTWACHVGAGRARNGTLLFLDADVTVEPGGLGRIAAQLSGAGGLVSVQPFHEVRRPHERLSAFFNVVALMGTGMAAPGARTIGAFGPVMLTTAGHYGRSGGHAAVAGHVAEDVALGRRYRDMGMPVMLLGGRGTVRFRMYPDGLRSLVEGWGKNIAGGAAATPTLRLLLVVAWLSLCITAPLGPAWLYLAVVAQLWWMLRRVGSFGLPAALLYPIPLAFFLALFGWAAVQAARGQVSWRGRKIARRK